MCSQRSNESAHKFACRCLALKKKIQNMAKDDPDLPFDDDSLSSTLCYAIYTGLRQNNTRGELRDTLKSARMSDEDLLLEISLASSHEEERLKKLNGGKSVDINKLTFDSDSEEPNDAAKSSSFSSFSSDSEPNSSNSNNKPSRKQAKAKKNDSRPKTDQNNSDGFSAADIHKMTAAFEQMTVSNAQLTAEVNTLREMTVNKAPSSTLTNPTSRVNGAGGSFGMPLNVNAPTFQANDNNRRPAWPNPRNNSRIVYRCQNCLNSNSPYCSHCFKCGSNEHKIKDCPVN